MVGGLPSALRLGQHDLAEDDLGRGLLPAPRQIAGELAARAQQSGGTGIIGFEQAHACAVKAIGLGRVAARFGDCGKVAEALRAHPDDRSHLAAAHIQKLGIRFRERVGRLGKFAHEAQRGAAKLERLAVEDLGLFLRKQSRIARPKLA